MLARRLALSFTIRTSSSSSQPLLLPLCTAGKRMFSSHTTSTTPLVVAASSTRIMYRYTTHTPQLRLSSTTANSSGTSSSSGSSSTHHHHNHSATGTEKKKGPAAGEEEDGFHEDAIVVTDEKGNAITRVRRQPLTLIEEVPLPVRVLTELELVMLAWCEEHARQYAMLTIAVRIAIFLLVSIVLYTFYKTQLSSERLLRGVDKIPNDLRIGNVVYFDVSEDGVEAGRIVIGLLNENCPLYCEYFHRRCTGSGETADSFRGMELAALVPRQCLVFGDGREMQHEVPGFDPHYLPTEHLSNGPWRGALSSIAYGPDRESPNFAMHVCAADYKPQVFGMIIGGYNVVERASQAGSKHGNSPKRRYVIEDCGELCTLAKSHITPMPWKLYNTISKGYDEEKFGERIPASALEKSDSRGGGGGGAAAAAVDAASVSKRWWFF